jgi:hypothetical protein
LKPVVDDLDINGFKEEDTGEHGVPPEIIQADRYPRSLPSHATRHRHQLDFFGIDRDKAERYIEWVRQRATKIRDGARAQGIE